MKRYLLRALAIALFTFLSGGCVYFLTDFDITSGLDNLFKLRGVRKPPADVVVVAMDEKTESRLGVGWKDYTLWRKFHAKLVQELHRQGAKLIIFDLQFIQPQPDIDRKFAASMREAGNVLATECVTKQNFWSREFSGREQCSANNAKAPVESHNGKVQQEYRVELNKYPPIPELAGAMLDHAPFYLPDDAKTPSIHEAWAFIGKFSEANQKPRVAVPTLPVVAWFHYLQRSGDLQTGGKVKAPLSVWLAQQRLECLNNPDKSQKNNKEINGLQKRISDFVCLSDDSLYIDFYGPPKTLRMESYSDVYEGKITDLNGKVVFVGKANLAYTSGGKTPDIFHTPFTTNEAGRMFGVEIMATVFANLLEGRIINSPISPLLVLAVFSLFMGVIFGQSPGFFVFATGLLLGGAYLAVTVWGFNRYGWWLPMAVPLFVQLPVAGLMALLWQIRDLLQERQRILGFVRRVFPNWVSFVPALPGQWYPEQGAERISSERDVYGLCLATDIEDYTQVASQHTPHEMWELLNAYYQVLGSPVNSHDGTIADVTGDAMMAIWMDLPIESQRLAACLAALEMEKEIENFNETSEKGRLPTRIGLNEGQMVLGSLAAGKGDHYRAIGDTVNTASRIQGVNKYLGTKILASSAIVVGLSEIVHRPVGKFILKGKDAPIELVEIIGLVEEVQRSYMVVYQQFSQGLTAFQQGNWKAAIADFETVLEKQADDGPSRFYLNLAIAYQQNNPAAWAGVITLGEK